VAVRVALEVGADLEGPREVRRAGVPREVGELHRVAALVGHHQRVDLAGGVVGREGPEPADARLRVEDGHRRGGAERLEDLPRGHEA
jgi:hypothetical protein